MVKVSVFCSILFRIHEMLKGECNFPVHYIESSLKVMKIVIISVGIGDLGTKNRKDEVLLPSLYVGMTG